MISDCNRLPNAGGRRPFAAALVVALMPAFALLAACSHFSQGNPTADYPEAEQFPQLYQGKLMAAAHWKLIAENEAALLARRFTPDSSFTVALPDPVHGSVVDTEFAVAYHHMLSAGLIEEGMRVFDEGGDFQLSHHIQVVEHSERSQANLPPGFFSGATTAAFLISKGLQSSTPGLTLFPIAAGADAYNYFNSDSATPNTEIVLTTAVRLDQQVLYSNSSVYYFRAVDRALYDGVEPEPDNPRGGFRVADPRGGV